MSKLIKRSIVIVCICCTCSFAPSCTSSSAYHDGKGTEWIQEQVKQGYITQEEAEILLQQEREEQ